MSSAADVEAVIEAIERSSRIVVIAHSNPDADAYGSSCGLALAIERLGKQVVVHNESGFIPRYKIIPGASEVKLGGWGVLDANDVVIVCDCGAIERVGDTLIPEIKAAPCVINIDHHTSNAHFGHINYVIEGASSTSELVYDIVAALEKRMGRSDILTSECAACLLAGIIGDTGSFRYASTSAKTFLVAHNLVLRGARPEVLTQELFGNHSLSAIKLQAEAMSNLALHYQGAFAEVVVTQDMVMKHKAELLDADSLAERARDIEGVRVSALYKQDKDLWRVSLRSRQGAVDVSAIAQSFGGGGHKPAAAFRWRKDLQTLQSQLREAIAKALHVQ